MQSKSVETIPDKVFLFSGHMIDAFDRKSPRFPADKEPVAKAAISDLLDCLHLGPRDIAICGGACGGDLLFAEAALKRGAKLEIYLPFDEKRFFAESVDFAGSDWHSRFLDAKSRADLHIMTDERNSLAYGESSFEQNNLWMLERALRFGSKKLEFICLWNGQGGDGPGGTEHLMQEAQRQGGHTHWLNTTTLWN